MIINCLDTQLAMEIYLQLLEFGIDVEYYQNSLIKSEYGWDGYGPLDDLVILDLISKARQVVVYDGNILDLPGNSEVIREYVLKNKNQLIFVPPLSKSKLEEKFNLEIVAISL
jgi:hypothetical protein